MLVNPEQSGIEPQLRRRAERGARRSGSRVQVLNASNDREIDAAFATFARQRADGAPGRADDAFFISRRDQIVALAARHAVARDLSTAASSPRPAV